MATAGAVVYVLFMVILYEHSKYFNATYTYKITISYYNQIAQADKVGSGDGNVSILVCKCKLL